MLICWPQLNVLTKHDSLRCRQHALAGTVAGLCTGVALHPLDLLKTRMQGMCATWMPPAVITVLQTLTAAAAR